jgi:DNA-binding SARP family transcriptional activator/tetratricopeptide (TPR) repeat protein
MIAGSVQKAARSDRICAHLAIKVRQASRVPRRSQQAPEGAVRPVTASCLLSCEPAVREDHMEKSGTRPCEELLTAPVRPGERGSAPIRPGYPRLVSGATIQLLGAFGVRSAGSAAVDAGVGSRKARRLLAVLAVANGRVLSLDAIVEALWPEGPPRRPSDNVATLVSRLRATLGAEVIAGGRRGYAIGPSVDVDLWEVAALLDDAKARPEAAAGLARRALELLGRGVVLIDEPDAEWVAGARAEGERLLRASRLVLVAAAMRAGDVGTAVDTATAAAAADRFDEESHRLLMTALLAAGEQAKALAAYETLRAALAEELGVDPSAATRELHLAILRDAPQPDRLPELIGREAELGVLTEAWAAAVAARPEVVLVAGEAGMGKTRLADTVAEHVRSSGGLVLAARCYGAERSLFLQPYVDALAPTLTTRLPAEVVALAGPCAPDLAGLLPQLSSVLGPPAPERGSPEMELRRVFEAVAHVLRGLAAVAPVMLLLDDLQNAGIATVELLHYLARRMGGHRILAVATVRAEEGEGALAALAGVSRRVDVGPLDEAAVARLAAADGYPELAATILRRTRGHTLFVVETLRGLRAGESGVPESLQSAVLARLHRAGEEAEELLRAGAVLGATVDPAVVAAMLDVAPQVALHRCERAAAARLLVVAGRSYEFANDLVQEVLYATTPEPVRVLHHRRAADLLTRSPEAVARHAAVAGDRPRATRALLLAGENALRRFALSDAEALFSRALEYADDAELLARARLARGRAREALGAFAESMGDYHVALGAARDAGDRRSEMLTLRALGGLASLALDAPIDESTERLLRGLRIAEALGDRENEAVLQGWLAVLATNRLRFTEALDRAPRAVAAAQAAGTDRALAAALDGLKNVHAYLGELTALAAVLDELEPLLRRIGDLELLQWAIFESAFAPAAAGEWERAQERVQEALLVNQRSGHPVHAAWFVAHLGWIARLRGRIDEAVEHGRRAVLMATPLAHYWFLPVCEAMLGVTLIEAGEPEEAVQLLTKARARIGRTGAEAHRLRCLAALAEAGGSREVLDEAAALLAGIDAPAESAWLPGADTYLAVGRAWLAHGEPARARAVVRPLRAAAARHGWRTVLAQADLVDGRAAAALGDPEAGRLLADAVRLAVALGVPNAPAEAQHKEAHLEEAHLEEAHLEEAHLGEAQISSANSVAARRAPSVGTGR